MSYCDDCIHKPVCYRTDSVSPSYADKCGDFAFEKTGHWIDDNENEIDAQYGIHLYKCSECDEYASAFVGGTEGWWDLEKPNYCPNCGRRMVEPQEGDKCSKCKYHINPDYTRCKECGAERSDKE